MRARLAKTAGARRRLAMRYPTYGNARRAARSPRPDSQVYRTNDSDELVVVQDETSEALSLFLFVHLALASDGDRGLAGMGLNRTHHRILFLVDRQPGVTVGEIVALLRVTQQAIQGPLRTLVDDGLIRQDSSERDRRRRHLYTTQNGRKLLTAISKMQYRRIAQALQSENSQRRRLFLAMMRAMLDEVDRERLYPPT